MSRKVRDTRIDTRTARRQLKPRREPYWRKIVKGKYLGYRKIDEGGTWVARSRDAAKGKQMFQALASADDVVDANGGTVLDFEQAQERARQWFTELETGGNEGQKPQPYTVKECMEDYLGWIKEHRKSHKLLKIYISAYIVPKLGHIDTSRLTPKHLQDWQKELASERPRLRTRPGETQRYKDEDPNPAEAERKRRLRANRHLVTLRAALNRAWNDGKIEQNDAWSKLKPFPNVERQRTAHLNTSEAVRLINACAPDFRNLVRLALYTGARYGELCAFNVVDFNLDSDTLLVRESKSGKARRVNLNEEGAKFCRQLVAGRPSDGPLLKRKDGSRWGSDHHTKRFKEAVKAANLTVPITFHGLRHTWASLAIMAGAPLMVVARNLGHRDTRMVELYYGHLADDYVSETTQQRQ